LFAGGEKIQKLLMLRGPIAAVVVVYYTSAGNLTPAETKKDFLKVFFETLA
jgi:hypothetical protein